MDSESPDTDYGLSDYSVELDGNELSGLETLSHMYGLAKREEREERLQEEREEQLQQFYQDLQGLCMRLSSGFRDESPRIWDQWDDVVDSYNEFFDTDYDIEDMRNKAAEGFVESGIRNGNKELEFWHDFQEEMSERNGMMSYDRFREIVLGQE